MSLVSLQARESLPDGAGLAAERLEGNPRTEAAEVESAIAKGDCAGAIGRVGRSR